MDVMVRPSGAVSFFSSDGTYFTCAGACSTLGNWSAPVALNFEVLQAVVDGAGVSHALLNKGRTANGEALLGYARCASGCSTPANWQSSALGFLTNAGLFTASLTATDSGRLFIAYNQGVITASTQDNQKLFVASCLGAGCLDLNTWTSFTTGVLDEGDSGAWVEASGEGVVLASNTVTELKVTACEVDCHLAASWSQAVVVDTSAAIAQAVNPAAGTTCPTTATFAAWYPKRPIIGIGPNGVAIVHNPSPLVRCLGTNVGTLPPIGRIITTF
ncbi:MAG: hypothetical protein IAE78_00745 [Myxococcus sp.]|nr:hypothetical protein [Myxococcus sp.]